MLHDRKQSTCVQSSVPVNYHHTRTHTVHALLVVTGVSSSVQCVERSYYNLLLMFFPVSFNFKLLATLLLFYIPVT